jgi:hypothetical protein
MLPHNGLVGYPGANKDGADGRQPSGYRFVDRGDSRNPRQPFFGWGAPIEPIHDRAERLAVREFRPPESVRGAGVRPAKNMRARHRSHKRQFERLYSGVMQRKPVR